MTEWRVIDEFSDYSVSDKGQVRNDKSGRIMAMSRNQRGALYVGLYQDGAQYKRSISVLVARAFLPVPRLEAFDTPINLDGNQENNNVENLMWRPRWFAIAYRRQFHNGRRGFLRPVVNLETGERFKTSWDAAIKYGLLDGDILLAVLNRTYVWPTFDQYEVLDGDW